MAAAVPPVGRRTVEALLATNANYLDERSLVLVYGQYTSGASAQFSTVLNEETRRVRVCDETSVLGIFGAWEDHRKNAAPGDVLVVTTRVNDVDLGWDLRGRAVRLRTLTVENAEVVMQRFGATSLDVRMYRENWLLEALIDAEPVEEGWPRIGGLLTRDAALRALVVQRLGLARKDGFAALPEQAVIDADALLAWSRTPTGPSRFAELPDVERGELKKWLGDTAGPAVPVLMSLVEVGLGQDAMALGILGAALRDPSAGPDTVLAIGGLFGQVKPRQADLASFADAVEGSLTRWLGEARGSQTARQRVFGVLNRADELARELELTEGLAASRFLPASFTAQLGKAVVEARRSAIAGEAALADLMSHGLAGLLPERVQTAEMAVRIARWLEESEHSVPSVADGVSAHVADWGWVDRALAVLRVGELGGDSDTARELGGLYEQARTRREQLDDEFARCLMEWSTHATAQHPSGCLVAEKVQEKLVRPLTGAGSPLVLVLGSMSSAVAAQLGEEVEREGWQEIVPRPPGGKQPGRIAAVPTLPTDTRSSRASLLTGAAATGDRSAESAGFSALWKRWNRDASLFHSADVGGDAGHALSHELMSALASEEIVGVVLSSIDDALDNDQQGHRASWPVGDITYLRELLAAARSYGRPVVLAADHGHVPEQGTRSHGRPAAQGEEVSARWRTGTQAEEGEVRLSGPRVHEERGTVVASWRQDIRYTERKAGYHGGASLAEVTAPVLVLVPAPDLTPKGWQVLPRERSAPPWWRAPVAGSKPDDVAPSDEARPSAGRTEPRVAGEGDQVAGAPPSPSDPSADSVQTPPSLGSRVVNSEVYAAQKEYVRRAPDAKVVAVIDALVAEGGTMSPAALAAAISADGRVRRNIEGFIATVQRLLNIEGYPVLGFVDAGHAVKLDVSLLHDQFLPKEHK